MEFIKVDVSQDLSNILKVLNESHLTVAKEFGFTKETNPTNNAFIDEVTLRSQLNNGIELHQMQIDEAIIGCIAIEKSSKETDTFYIEKVSVIPAYRHHGYGVKLMDYATSIIKQRGGKTISIALIEENTRLKKWYINQGFIEIVVKKFEHLPFRVCFMSKKV